MNKPKTKTELICQLLEEDRHVADDEIIPCVEAEFGACEHAALRLEIATAWKKVYPRLKRISDQVPQSKPRKAKKKLTLPDPQPLSPSDTLAMFSAEELRRAKDYLAAIGDGERASLAVKLVDELQNEDRNATAN